jgi:MT0933-like antitoxin protein
MGFADFADKAKAFADEHDEQVDQGLDKAGDLAKERFGGHDEQIDSVVDRAQQYTGGGDTTAVPAAGTDPAPEVPADQPPAVPAGPDADPEQ